MKNFWRNLVIGCSLWLFTVGSAVAEEKANLDPNVGKNLSVAKCIAKGNLDFVSFLKSVTLSDGLYESLFEPFNDVLTRNQCQANDVAGLIHQRDKLRTYIRDAFLTCTTEKLPNYRIAFYKTNAEIYYVRHVVDGGVILSTPYDLLSTRHAQDPNSLYVPSETLYADIKAKYAGEGKIPADDYDLFFSTLEKKYKERKVHYIKCDNSSWNVVEEKWAEFVESAGGIAPAVEDAKNDLGGRAEKVWEAASDFTYNDFLIGTIKATVNRQGIKPGVKEISDEFVKNLPGFEGSPSQEDLFSAVGTSNKAFDVATMQATLQATFEAEYKEVSDSVVQSFVEELNTLNDILKKSLSPLDKVLSCTKDLNSRQCPGN